MSGQRQAGNVARRRVHCGAKPELLSCPVVLSTDHSRSKGDKLRCEESGQGPACSRCVDLDVKCSFVVGEGFPRTLVSEAVADIQSR